jgi:hypothetical protein
MWPALVTLAAVAALHAALPDKLAVFSHRWILASVVVILAVPLEIFHRRGIHECCRAISYTVLIGITLAMIGSVYLLVSAILTRAVAPDQLLLSAGILWLTNIAVFAVWYWRLDAGGPHKRGQRESHSEGAFLFPQMVPSGVNTNDGQNQWSPEFIDYLFLAFNTSTALSPTDSPVLSRWAKGLMMIQSLTALTIIALLAARAVNIL